jgi:hypothetical protein
MPFQLRRLSFSKLLYIIWYKSVAVSGLLLESHKRSLSWEGNENFLVEEGPGVPLVYSRLGVKGAKEYLLALIALDINHSVLPCIQHLSDS